MKKIVRSILALAAIALPSVASAQTVVLDVGHYHGDYTGALFQSIITQLEARSNTGGVGTYTLTYGDDISTVNLNNYRALYFQESSGYTFGANDVQVQSFMASGGSIGFEALYDPFYSSFFNGILGFDLGAAIANGGCYDDETTNATGLAFGLSAANPNVGCYGHGALIDANLPVQFASLATTASFGAGYSTISALEVTATPEPTSFILFGSGFAGIVAVARRRRATSV